MSWGSEAPSAGWGAWGSLGWASGSGTASPGDWWAACGSAGARVAASEGQAGGWTADPRPAVGTWSGAWCGASQPAEEEGAAPGEGSLDSRAECWSCSPTLAAGGGGLGLRRHPSPLRDALGALDAVGASGPEARAVSSTAPAPRAREPPRPPPGPRLEARGGEIAAALERGFAEEEARCGGRGGEFLDFLRLLPNKDWVPFGAYELEPHQGAFGAPGGAAVEFYLRPSLMPVGGFFGWQAHPVYQKDLAFMRKDSVHEIRLNKEIATRWNASELLAFAEVRSSEFDVANAVTTVHRIAKASDRWSAKRDPRLRRIIAQTVDILMDPTRKSTARDVAKTQWAMGRLKHSDRNVQEKLAQEVLRHLDELQPQGLSNVLWSYAYIGAPNGHVLQAVISEFRVKMLDCDPQALGNVSWSLAKLLVINVPLLAEIAHEAIKKARGFDPQGLANLAWAFATVLQEDAPLFECIGDVLAEDPSRWQPQNLANLLWAYAKLLVTHQRLLDAVAEETVATVDNWNHQGLANVTWAYAKLGCMQYRRFFDRISTAVMQKISTFTPQNTVNIAWAYSKLGLGKADLMDAIAQDAIAKSHDFTPQHCSNTAWAFGNAGILNDCLMESLADAAERRVAEFNGQDLANVVWACAKLVWAHAALLETLARDVMAKAGDFSPQNVAITAWSFGCLVLAHEPMMAAFARDVPLHVGQLGAQGLCNLAHGFAKQSIRNGPAMELIAREAECTIGTFTNQELSATAWAFAKLGLSPPNFVGAVAEEMRRRIADLTPQDLAMLAWSFAHFEGAKSRKALEDISWEVLRQMAHLGPQDLTNVCWALATAGFENAMMMNAVAQEVIKNVDRFTAQDLSNTSWAFAKLGLTEDDMFDAISVEVTKKVGTLLPQNLSIISWAYAKLGLLNEPMMEAIADEVLKRVAEFDGQGLGNVIWSFAVLGLRQYWAMAQAVTERAIIVVTDLTAQEISNIAWGLSSMGHSQLLARFLAVAVARFLEIVGASDGASFTDLANVVACQTRTEGSRRTLAGGWATAAPRDSALELDIAYRNSLFEPLLSQLADLREGEESEEHLAAAVESTQRLFDETGAPYFGPAYTWEALGRLRIQAPGNGATKSIEPWASAARARCREAVGDWQIPSTHSIVAFARWDLVWHGEGHSNGGALRLLEEGRVFVSGWSEGVGQDVKELLHAFTQIIKRDMHAERVALLELVDTMVRRAPGRAAHQAALAAYAGTVQLYLSHFPSLSSLAVFCQFLRRCSGVQLAFDFDDAWRTCCGSPRFAAVQ